MELFLKWKDDLAEMVWAAEGKMEHVGRRKAYKLMSDMAEYMEQQLQQLLSAGMVSEARDLIFVVLNDALSVDMDDPKGGLVMLTERCLAACRKLYEQLPGKGQKELYRDLELEIKLLESYGNTVVSDGMEELFLELDWKPALQKENLAMLDAYIKIGGTRNRRMPSYLAHRERIMRRLGASEKEVVSFWKEHIEYSAARERLLLLYLQQNKEPAEEMPKDKKEDGWIKRFAVLSEEGRYQQLLDEIGELSYLPYLKQFEKELKAWSEEKTLECYTRLLNQEMLRAKDRRHYCAVAKQLSKLGEYPNGNMAAEELVRQWKESFKKHKAMLEELQKAGF